jgi:hypothetical protein
MGRDPSPRADRAAAGVATLRGGPGEDDGARTRKAAAGGEAEAISEIIVNSPEAAPMARCRPASSARAAPCARRRSGPSSPPSSRRAASSARPTSSTASPPERFPLPSHRHAGKRKREAHSPGRRRRQPPASGAVGAVSSAEGRIRDSTRRDGRQAGASRAPHAASIIVATSISNIEARLTPPPRMRLGRTRPATLPSAGLAPTLWSWQSPPSRNGGQQGNRRATASSAPRPRRKRGRCPGWAMACRLR